MIKRVLICDDDPDILSICTYILERQGFKVFTSIHCNNIVDIVKQAQPGIILMDNRIPDTGGIVASQTIKNEPGFKNIPIIYFSANNDIKTLAQKAGVDAFLAKPFDLEELEKIIRNIMPKGV